MCLSLPRPSHDPEHPAVMSNRSSHRLFSLFVGLWLFVIFVSVFDGYLVVRYRHELQQTELNPLGRLLIRLNGGQVWLLLAAKFAGTVVAATLVLLIYGRWPSVGITVASVVAGLQLCLLLFLLLA
jgi:hypothetical protein